MLDHASLACGVHATAAGTPHGGLLLVPNVNNTFAANNEPHDVGDSEGQDRARSSTFAGRMWWMRHVPLVAGTRGEWRCVVGTSYVLCCIGQKLARQNIGDYARSDGHARPTPRTGRHVPRLTHARLPLHLRSGNLHV